MGLEIRVNLLANLPCIVVLLEVPVQKLECRAQLGCPACLDRDPGRAQQQQVPAVPMGWGCMGRGGAAWDGVGLHGTASRRGVRAAGRRGGGAARWRGGGRRAEGLRCRDAQRVEKDCNPGEAKDGAILLVVVTVDGVVRLEVAPLLARGVLEFFAVEALEGLREARGERRGGGGSVVSRRGAWRCDAARCRGVSSRGDAPARRRQGRRGR